MKGEEIAKLLAVIAGNYGSFKPNEFTLPSWCAILEGYSFDDAQKALMHYMAGPSEFAPTPGRLRHIVEESRRPKELTGQEALAIVLGVARRYYADRKAAREALLRHPQIYKAVKLLGWDTYTALVRPYNPHGRGISEDEAQRRKGLFVSTYNQLQARDEHDEENKTRAISPSEAKVLAFVKRTAPQALLGGRDGKAK